MDVADNTGALSVRCIKVLKGSRRRYAGVGDLIVCSVKSARPRSSVPKKSVVKAVIVRQKRKIRRNDGTVLNFESNACVIVDEEGNPKGSRVMGPVARELRDSGYLKICSLAREVV
ncbi:LSU ribosomal protein L14p (L23e) [Candidatus Similichlamydia laticola]|uniref:Large ribosomal subunit protein uL14 n=1 Tax=Candidatus Similichlamydia laticola TaxID=2170265 RepID=A0A369KBU7_9BACT|nr:LSU ribosomal protein L14p (L23e) [Candidatus Similichlamydia laticola]